MNIKNSKFSKFLNYRTVSAFVVIIAVGLIGAHILFKSHAATPLAPSVLGAYAGATNVSGVNALGTLVGHHLNYAMDFQDGTSWSTITQSSWPYADWKGSGYTMIWGIPILPNAYSPNSNISVVNGSCYGLNQGAQGQFNSYFTTVAKNIVNNGFPNSVIRLGWEFNGGWFPWSANGCASQFNTYWQNIVTAMRSVPGEQFKFEWNPTLGDQGIGNLANYYPGNNYVDLIGEDVYDLNWNNYPGCQANWQGELSETYGLNWFASFSNSNGKQMTLPEWGLGWGTDAPNCGTVSNSGGQTFGGDNAYFIQQMVNYINSNNFAEVTAWDYGTDPLPDASKSPNATAAFITGFSGTVTNTPDPSAPTNVTAAAPNANTVNLSWSASSDTGGPGIGGYNIFRDGTEIKSVGATTKSYSDTSVSASTSYQYTIEAFDTSTPPNVSAASTAVSVTTPPAAVPDPSTPTNVTATATSSQSVTVSWTASTDTGGPGLGGYYVFRNGAKTSQINASTTTFADTTVAASTSYSYTVEAFDTAGNVSGMSSAAPVTTPPPTNVPNPAAPTGVSAKANSSTSVTVSWKAATDTGGPGIGGYYVIRDGVTLKSVGASTTSYNDTSVSPSTGYSYTLESFDTSNPPKVSTSSTPAADVTTPASQLTAPPTAPTGLAATVVSSTQINLSWTASTDPGGPGVGGYIVFVNGHAVNTSPITSTSFGDSGLSPATSYSFYVEAVNTLGSPSPASGTVSATTNASYALYPPGTIVNSLDSGSKCLDNNLNKAVNFNLIDLWSCNGTGAQQWNYHRESGTILNSNGYCLDVHWDSNASGTIVDLYQCNGTAAQSFTVNAASGTPGTITNRQSGLCLDDKWAGTNNGNQIWMYTCNGTAAQKWTVN